MFFSKFHSLVFIFLKNGELVALLLPCSDVLIRFFVYVLMSLTRGVNGWSMHVAFPSHTRLFLTTYIVKI